MKNCLLNLSESTAFVFVYKTKKNKIKCFFLFFYDSAAVASTHYSISDLPLFSSELIFPVFEYNQHYLPILSETHINIKKLLTKFALVIKMLLHRKQKEEDEKPQVLCHLTLYITTTCPTLLTDVWLT